MRKFAIIIFVFFCPVLWGEPASVLTGIVRDSQTGKPLENVNVTVAGISRGSATDKAGQFEIKNVTPGIYTVKASRIDYESKMMRHIVIGPGEHKELVIQLKPRVIEMQPIQVEADKFSLKYQTEVARIGFQQIKPTQIKTLAGGMDDISRSIQIFSSVMPASDYNAYFAVRGGSPEQNLVIMDGMTIPNPYRFRLLLGGGMSIFDPNATEDVRLHIGGFSAEFGNFLSSVLEVDTREGNRHRFCGRASLNLIDASAVMEGPIVKGKGSWLISARRTYYDLLANRFYNENVTFPNTADINGKFVYHFDKNNKLSLRTLWCQEGTDIVMGDFLNKDYTIIEDSKIQLLGFNWLRIANQKLTHQTTLSYYDEYFNFNMDFSKGFDHDKIIGTLDSQMGNLTVKEDVIYEFSDRIWMMRGLSFSTMRSDIDADMPNNPMGFARRDFPPSMQFNGRENYFAFYMDDIYKIKDYFHVKAGLRYDHSSLNKKSTLSPRLSLWIQLSGLVSLEGFWGTCSQYPAVLSSFIRNTSMDLSKNISDLNPERSMHTTLGLHFHISSDTHGKLELYYKNLDDLLFASNQSNWMADNIGKGYAKGIELYIRKEIDEKNRYGGIVSYSYGDARYQDTINQVWIPFHFDRRHSASIMFQFGIMQNLNMNVLWRLSSGLPYNSKRGLIDTEGANDRYIEDETVKKYFPAYQRLDCRLNYTHRRGDTVFSMYIDITNISNHKNIYDHTWFFKDPEDLTELHQKIIELRTLYMLPLIPSFGLSIQF